MRNKLETTKHLSDQLNSHKCIKSHLLSLKKKKTMSTPPTRGAPLVSRVAQETLPVRSGP